MPPIKKRQRISRPAIAVMLAAFLAAGFAGALWFATRAAYSATSDLNSDGKVDVMDFSILLSNWSKTASGLKGDLDGNGTVNIIDLSTLLSHWGSAVATPTPTPATPTPTPPTGGINTYIGACPANPGGTSLTAAQSVLNKWGTGAAIRQFNGDITTGPNHPSGASIVHTSYRPSVSQVNSGALDTQIEALIQRTPAGDVIEFYHEPDNDGLTGTGITDMIKAKNRLYEIKQRVKPTVLVAATMTGGFFANYTSESVRQPWYGLKGDLVGLDADGVHDSTGPTYDTSYADEIAGVKTFMTRNPSAGWIGWGVPEHGTSRQPWDTTGTPRANWFAAQTKLMIDAGARYVMLYDYNTSAHQLANDYNQILTGTPEFTVWNNLVDNNPH
ncbi:MAG: Dockerin type domain [Candidatus Saccharibacteria bacterium]|jgi:hypothetical protein|nr:Dockerin type domain [Candidatus Saccharibacteria bacterium]